MRRRLIIAALALLGAAALAIYKAEEAPITYYVQLLRGGNTDVPPVAGSKSIGSKLSKALRPVFSWTNYWEISRRQVRLSPGKKTKVRLSSMREVEINLTDPGIRQVTAFQDGKSLIKASQPTGDTMTIFGGEHEKGGIWFVVVRRDKPGE